MSLVAALLAAREREIQNPRDEANRVASRKAKQALARELGGEEHIPLAIEIYSPSPPSPPSPPTRSPSTPPTRPPNAGSPGATCREALDLCT